MSALSLVLALAGAAALPMELSSDSECPSADAVRMAVGTLVSDAAVAPNAEGAPLRVLVRRGDTSDHLLVQLEWNEGKRSRVQRLAVGADCGARAEAAAVAVASWLGVLPNSSAPSPPLEATPLPLPPPAPAVVLAPRSPPSLQGAPPAPVLTGPRAWLGAGVGVAAGGGVAPALRLEATGARVTTGFSWSVAAFGSGQRAATLGPGTSRWLRPGLELAARGLWRVGTLLASSEVGAVAAFTFASGSGYPVDRRSVAAGAGVALAIRIERAVGNPRFWAEIRALTWPSQQRLRYTDVTTGEVWLTGLPKLEVLATVGASFRLSGFR